MGTTGVTCMAGSVKAIVENIKKAEQYGIKKSWLTAGGFAAESMTTFAAAAAQTQSIEMGTCIVQAMTRHPLSLASAAIGINNLAPGRFYLGVGSSHAPAMKGQWGFDFDRPLHHLREYVTILNGVLKAGKVDFEGDYFKVHADLGQPTNIPVLISALQKGSFRLAGELTDGAITWVTPVKYVVETAIPAMEEGAAKSGRKRPPVVLHVPIAVSEDDTAVREAARQQLGFYPKATFYQRMLTAAGFEEAVEGNWSDRMLDAVIVQGNEASVKQQIEAIYAQGIDEIIAMPLAVAPDKAGSVDRTWKFLGTL